MRNGLDREIGLLRASTILFNVRQLGGPARSGMCQCVFTFVCLAEAQQGYNAAYGWFYFLTEDEIGQLEASSGQLQHRTWRHYSVRWFVPTDRDHQDADTWREHLIAVRASYSRR